MSPLSSHWPFLVWIPLALAGFWLCIIAPLHAQRGAAALQLDAQLPQLAAAARSLSSPGAAAAASTRLVWLDAQHCDCAGPAPSEAELRGVAARYGHAFHRASAAEQRALRDLPLRGQDLIVVAADGRLLLVGGTHAGAFCSGGRSAAPLLLAALARRSDPSPLLIPAPCSCAVDAQAPIPGPWSFT